MHESKFEYLVLNEIIQEELEAISILQKMKECIELRLELLNENKAIKSESAKNEDILLSLKSKFQIMKLDRMVKQRKQMFQIAYDSYMEELNSNAD